MTLDIKSVFLASLLISLHVLPTSPLLQRNRSQNLTIDHKCGEIYSYRWIEDVRMRSTGIILEVPLLYMKG